MSAGDREGRLITRIRQIRRTASESEAAGEGQGYEAADAPGAPSADTPGAPSADEPGAGAPSEPSDAQTVQRSLETRVAHLEQLVQGLQDSVYREFERHDKLIAELQAQIKPGAMGAALADDARQRGL